MRLKYGYQVIATMLLVCLAACGPADHPAMKRGKDWLDVGNYERARYEFQVVISEQPKNVPARVEIARTYQKQRALTRSLQWANDALAIEPGNSEAKKLIDAVAENASELLLSSVWHQVDEGLRIAEQLPRNAQVAALKQLVIGTDKRHVQRAEEVLAKIDEDAIGNALVEALNAPDLALQQRIAERVFNEQLPHGVTRARRVLAEKYVRVLETANNDPARSHVSKKAAVWLTRIGLGADEADILERVLVVAAAPEELLRNPDGRLYHPPLSSLDVLEHYRISADAAALAVVTFAITETRSGFDAIAGKVPPELDRYGRDNRPYTLCRDIFRRYAAHLAKSGKQDALPALKSALELVSTLTSYGGRLKCIASYEEAIAAISP